MKRTWIFVPLLLLLAGVPAQGQVVARGLLQQGPLVSICMDGATHILACSNLRIRPGAFDLRQFEGQWVRVEGALTQLNPACIRLDLASIQVIPERLDAVGRWTPGGSVDLTVHGSPGTLQFLFLSPGRPGLMPMGPAGTFFLDPSLLFSGGMGGIGPGGTWQSSLRIPGEPSLLGLRLGFQSVLLQTQPVLLSALLNAVCVEIK